MDADYQLILSECATCTLTDLIHKEVLTEYQFKVLLFQVFYTLFVVQEQIPSFRHNDLHTSNILIQTLEPPKDLTKSHTVYCIPEKTYYHSIRPCPYRCLLWDMYFSNMSLEECPTSIVSSVPSQQQRSSYVDVHKLIDSLEYVLRKTSTSYQSRVQPYLQDFIDLVVPLSAKRMTRSSEIS